MLFIYYISSNEIVKKKKNKSVTGYNQTFFVSASLSVSFLCFFYYHFFPFFATALNIITSRAHMEINKNNPKNIYLSNNMIAIVILKDSNENRKKKSAAIQKKEMNGLGLQSVYYLNPTSLNASVIS